MTPVEREQRFSAERRCPICGGFDALPRGQQERCYGFLSSNGRVAYCTREEHAGELPFDDTKNAFRHTLGGGCACGQIHAAKIGAEYSYCDEGGEVLFQVVRMAPKAFRQRRPDGRGGWVWDLNGVRRVLYRLDQLQRQSAVAIVEGEKDVDRLWALGIPATCNPMGAGKWHDEYARQLVNAHVQTVYIFRDHDSPGERHAEAVERSCQAAGLQVCRVHLPGDPKDVSDWLDDGHATEELLALIETAPAVEPDVTGASSSLDPSSPWGRAIPASEFLAGTDTEQAWIEYPFLAAGIVTELYAPRGLGKTLFLYWLLVKVARAGRRVLLIDRDNPRAEIRKRLKSWGAAELQNLDILPRDDAPSLTDRGAWEQFPLGTYDVIALDSLDSSTEGVGEQDSGRAGKAFATLLDVVRAQSGPATIVLGNTLKSGHHARGSGVIEDRADVSFEVRDATDLKPTGEKPWLEELPEAGVGAWAQRAQRRKRRTKYRLAFAQSKFRVGQEPEPFILEIDLTTEPWTLRDVTEEVVAASEAAQTEAQQQRAAVRERAAERLAREISLRADSENPMRAGEAEDLLMGEGLSQAQARKLIRDDGRWRAEQLKDKRGKPKVLLPRLSRLSDAPVQSRSNENQQPSESSLFMRPPHRSISVIRMDTERPESAASKPAQNAGSAFPLPDADSADVEVVEVQ